MKLWNGYRWTEYSGEPLTGPVLAGAGAIESLDPAVSVVADDGHVPAIEAAHDRFRAEHAATGEHPRVELVDAAELARATAEAEASKMPGVMPTPLHSFTFDTSDEED